MVAAGLQQQPGGAGGQRQGGQQANMNNMAGMGGGMGALFQVGKTEICMGGKSIRAACGLACLLFVLSP